MLVVCVMRGFPMFEILYSDASCECGLCVMDVCEETKCVQSVHDFQIKYYLCIVVCEQLIIVGTLKLI